jgi:hypothetical protein
VDDLHIFGNVDEEAAATMEKLLWGLLPNPPKVHPQLGKFMNGHQQFQSSRTLALSQLMVAHYLLNAALDHHVI